MITFQLSDLIKNLLLEELSFFHTRNGICYLLWTLLDLWILRVRSQILLVRALSLITRVGWRGQSISSLSYNVLSIKRLVFTDYITKQCDKGRHRKEMLFKKLVQVVPTQGLWVGVGGQSSRLWLKLTLDQPKPLISVCLKPPQGNTNRFVEHKLPKPQLASLHTQGESASAVFSPRCGILNPW